MALTFDDIFPEYFTLYRGQATSTPSSSDPEYRIAIQLANSSIRKWDRADGMEWPELWKNLSDNVSPTLILADTYSYLIEDMRKPPKQISVGGATDSILVRPEQVDLTGSTGVSWFTGGASTGYTLHFRNISTEMVGLEIDCTYLKKPNLIVNGASVIEMSDPTFLIHDMLAARFTNARNGFAVKVHKQEARTALQNMKVEAMSGTYGNSDNMGGNGGLWGHSGAGVRRNASII